ncbi:MAG: DUF3592 domain-containing protein, partial [SAR202 cluster bacterium]|nr:DUF3592 domain-containing protein [SAR202 cluster bacterium]
AGVLTARGHYRGLLLLLSLMCLAAGAAFLWIQADTFGDYLAARSWPTTEGRIVAASFYRPGVKGTLEAEIVFTWTVQNQTYQSNRWAPDTGRSVELIKQYQAGRSVTVTYNPGHPSQGYLEPGRVTVWFGVFLAISVGFVGLGILFLVQAIRTR